AGGDERLRNSAAAIGARAVRLAERNAVPLEMLNHSRSWNLGRKIDDGPDHPTRFDGRRDPAAGINPSQTPSIPISAVALEIPPLNSILAADDGGLWPQHRPQLGRKLRQAVRLHPKEDNVHRSHFFEGAGDGGPRHKISL